jgi:hypothetical protein
MGASRARLEMREHLALGPTRRALTAEEAEPLLRHPKRRGRRIRVSVERSGSFS